MLNNINTITIIILITVVPLLISILNTNNINIIMTIISGFPLLLSILNSIIKQLINLNIPYINYFLKIIVKILDILDIKPDKQLDTLIFTNIIAIIQGIIFFINLFYFKDLFKTFVDTKNIDTKYKLQLLLQNIIVTVLVFILYPVLNNYII